MTTKKELKILAHLRKDGRIKLTELAKFMDMPQTTTFDAFRRVTKKYVKRHISLIDFEELYYGIRIFYMIRVNKEKRNLFSKFLENEPCVNTILRYNDGNSFIVECVFSTIKEVHNFKERVMDFSPLRVEHHEILEEVTRESFLSNPELIDHLIEV